MSHVSVARAANAARDHCDETGAMSTGEGVGEVFMQVLTRSPKCGMMSTEGGEGGLG